MQVKYKIKKERVENSYYYDVYIFADDCWEIIDSFQHLEDAKKFVENDKKNSKGISHV